MRVPSNEKFKAYTGKIPVGWRYTVGLAGQEFLKALRDKGEILGSRCEQSGNVYVPASIFCESSFEELTKHEPVASEGEVVTFSICHRDLDGQPLDPPRIAAAVRLDGATSVLVHNGLGDPAKWKIGARAKVKLAEKREGSILDIEGFELV